MERNKVKQGIMLITYSAILVLLLVYCKDILHGVGTIFGLLKSFIMGIGIAFVLNQPYQWLRQLYHKKLHLKEKTAGVLGLLSAYLLVIAVIAGVIGIVIPQLVKSGSMFADNMNFYLANLQQEIDFWTQRLHLESLDLSNVWTLLETNLGKLSGITEGLLPRVMSVTGTMVSFVVNLFIAIAFSVYLLGGKERILGDVDRMLRVFLPKHVYKRAQYVLDIVVTSFKNYIIGQSMEAVILGSLCFVGMLILRLEYAGMVSMVVALTALIPILGAYIGGVVAVILLFMVSPIKAGIFLTFFVCLQQFENNVIYPRVVGGRIGLPGIWVLLAITVGGKLGGVVGMLLGVPTVTVLYTLLKNAIAARERKDAPVPVEK